MIGLDQRLAAAQQVADAVLYEGYVLYPYRASAGKNQLRWTFGLLAPQDHVAQDPSESSAMRTEMILEGGPATTVHIRVRYLHVQSRTVWSQGRPVAALEVGDAVWTSFEEAVERGVELSIGVGETSAVSFTAPGAHEEEEIGEGALLVRERHPISGTLEAHVEMLDGPYRLCRLHVEIANVTPWGSSGARRGEVCGHSLAAVHTLVAVDAGRLLSVLDPPEFARPAVAGCRSSGTFPVLISDDVALSSPITLYDHPAIAPESEGDMFDSTEIDEILALRVLTLTDDEKREARATDPRAAAVIDRCAAMTPETFSSLHGTFRSVEALGLAGSAGLNGSTASADAELPWWEPAVDEAFDPWTDTVRLGATCVGKGSRVVLRPNRRSDAQDLFVIGRAATVAGVFHDVDGDVYLAVTVDDDPAADLHQWHGRYLYFLPDEVEVVTP